MDSDVRKKLKEDFLLNAEKMDDTRLLTLLLSFAVPLVDMSGTAEDLLFRFGNITNILNAQVGELTESSGIGEHTAVLLKLIPVLTRRYLSAPAENNNSFYNEATASEYLTGCFAGLLWEHVYVLCIDSYGNLIDKRMIHRGSVNSAMFSIRLITQAAIENNCGAVILAHNHPNGKAIPSDDDLFTTERIAVAMSVNEITLVEHYVVAGEKCIPIVKNMPSRYGSGGYSKLT